MGYIQHDNVVKQSHSIVYSEQLSKGTYLLQLNQMTGEFFFVVQENFTLPEKVYGNIDSQIDRYLKTYHSREGNLGILLSGFKGTGKSLLAKALCIKSDLPVIIITDAYSNSSFKDFIANINQDCILFFDEFEKIYKEEHDAQSELLTLLDGTFSGKKIFLFTINEVGMINDHMINRPGRIWYNKHYSNLDKEVINNVIDDLLENKDYTKELLNVIDVIGIKSLDILISLIYEINLHDDSPKISANEMCLLPDSNISYRTEFYYKNTKLQRKEFADSHPGSEDELNQDCYLNNKEIELFPELEGMFTFHHLLKDCTLINNKGVVTVTTKEDPDKRITFTQYETYNRYVF